jgi:hypothetical protein
MKLQFKFIRQTTDVPFFGDANDPSQERKDDAATNREFLSNLWGSRFVQIGLSPDNLSFTNSVNDPTMDEIEWFNVNCKNPHSSLYPSIQNLISYCHNNNITIEETLD